MARTWASLKNQTHQDWEWIIYDDSTTDDVYRQVYGFCSDERYRIRYFRPMVPSAGNIGYVKNMAFSLGLGDVLVELDHDDELTTDCLAELRVAFDENPDAGFVWSDCCEILPSGFSGRYPEGWGLGYGSDYWDEQHQVWAMRVPVNRTTLSHIVSMPNHVRAWRRNVYFEIGGHSPNYRVADDYELMLRTAINTHMVHIPKMLYKQHIAPTTAQRTMNGEIQRLVPEIHAAYGDRLDDIYGVIGSSQ
jgi:glycosyltransferase involved in cell wall biosynthesis